MKTDIEKLAEEILKEHPELRKNYEKIAEIYTEQKGHYTDDGAYGKQYRPYEGERWWGKEIPIGGSEEIELIQEVSKQRSKGMRYNQEYRTDMEEYLEKYITKECDYDKYDVAACKLIISGEKNMKNVSKIIGLPYYTVMKRMKRNNYEGVIHSWINEVHKLKPTDKSYYSTG